MEGCLISSVENGVVAVSFSKDYEIQSWNEQGEILHKEGMLTICFSYISLCSHRDRKELYLIIKIPYMVNMSLKDKDFGLGKGMLPVNIDLYAKWVEEVPKLEERIKELESENKELKLEISLTEKSFNEFAERVGIKIDEHADEIIKKIEPFAIDYKKKLDELEDLTKKINGLQQEHQTLKEKLGIVDSEWQIERDLAWRNNPVTGEFEQYGFPTFFSVDKVRNLRFTDEKKYMYHFSYKISDEEIKEYDMPVSLYNYIKKYYDILSVDELFMSMKKEVEQKGKKEMDIHELQDEESLTKYILSKGGSLRGKYQIKAIKFIVKTRGKEFDIHEFDKYCGFQDNRESRRQHIKKLISWGLIKQTKNQRVYQNLI